MQPRNLKLLTLAGLGAFCLPVYSSAAGIVSLATEGFTLGSASNPGGNTIISLNNPTTNGVGGYAVSALNSHTGQNQTYFVYGNAVAGAPAALVTQGAVAFGSNTLSDYTYAGIGLFSLANDGSVLYPFTSTRVNGVAPSVDALLLKTPGSSTPTVITYDGLQVGGTSSYASKYYGYNQSTSSIATLSSAKITQAGNAYFFIDGVSNTYGGSQTGAAIFMDTPGNAAAPILKVGDAIAGTSGLTVGSGYGSIDTSNFGISASGTNYIDQITTTTGSTMIVTGTPSGGATKMLSVGSVAPGGRGNEVWTGFSRSAINDAGTTAVAASVSSGGYAIAINGAVQFESGSTLPVATGGTVTLAANTSPNPDIKLNSDGDYATIYADYPVPGPGTQSKGKLIFDGIDIADTGTLYDSNGDGIPDTALTSINPGRGLSLGEVQSNGTADLYFFGSSNGNTTNILLRDTVAVTAGPASLSLVNSSVNGVGNISSTTSLIAGTSALGFTAGGNVAVYNFSGHTGPFTLTTFSVVSPASTTICSSTDYTFAGAGGIGGSGYLLKTGSATLTLSNSNSYTGGTNVSSGTLVLASAIAFPSATSLTIASGATVTVANHGSAATYVPVASALVNTGTLDLTNDAMVIQSAAGSIGTITAQVVSAYNNGLWTGANTSGVITSSVAAADSTHLTAIGIATGFTSFENQTVSPGDLLIKYTYYGDATLDGQVDASDYSRIDNGYVNALTGWYNGDFNYDGVVNGSDYTLIDNAFNTQQASLQAMVEDPFATSTSQIAVGSSVPEPTAMGFFAMTAATLSRRVARRSGMKNIREGNKASKACLKNCLPFYRSFTNGCPVG